jgi:hypothetical protein
MIDRSIQRVVTCTALLLVGAVGVPIHAQSLSPSGWDRLAASRLDTGPIGSAPSARRTGVPERRPGFGRVLLGSTVGTAVGVGSGLLLLGAVEGGESNGSQYDDDDPEAEAARTITMIGIACIVAGGPVGAVALGGIERNRRAAYVGAGIGEVMIGVLGYVLAQGMHARLGVKLAGAGVGVAVGAAGGAILGARSADPASSGMLRYEDGAWTAAIPDIRMRPHLASARPPALNVTMLSLRW